MKILVIKLGAKGDVVRTLPVLLGIKEKYPDVRNVHKTDISEHPENPINKQEDFFDSEIHWLVKKSNIGVIEGSPEVSKIWTLENPPNEKFDILYNFDVEEEATALAMKIPADRKYGFYSENGFASAFNLGAEYYLNTMFDDNTKINNRKTYQEMMFNAAELPYKKQHHTIYLSDEDKLYAEEFIKINKIKTEKLIGIHMGAGPRWPSKAWAEEKVKGFIQLAKSKGYEILLFGGPDESEKQGKLTEALKKQNILIYRNNPLNTDKQFASLVNLCNVIVCSDSFALHVSLAFKKPTIGLFFCTPYHEIEGYNLFKPIASPMLYEFFPEKMNQFSEQLINSISAEEVMKEVENISF